MRPPSAIQRQVKPQLASLVVFSLLVAFFFSMLLVMHSSEAHVLDGTSDEFQLRLTLNATAVNPTDPSIKAIQVTAQLLDDEDQPVDEDDVPVTFRTNASTFIENGQDVITVNTMKGVATVHLRPYQGEGTVSVTASLESNGGFTSSRQIIFSMTVDTRAGDSNQSGSNPQDDNNDAFQLPDVNLNRLVGILEGVGTFSSLAYPMLLFSIGLLMALGFAMAVKRTISWGTKKALSAEIGFFTKLQMAFIGLIGAVVTRSWLRRVDEHDVTFHPLRRKILNMLERKRIVHLRELQRELNCSMSTLIWHLQVLEDFNYVKSVKHGQYIAYYLSDLKPSKETLKVYFGMLNDKSRKIIEVLLSEQRMISSREIERLTNIDKSNLRYHLKKLANLGIIVQRKEFRPPRYALHPKYLNFIRLQLNEHDNYYLQPEAIDFDSDMDTLKTSNWNES